jgi:ATP-binding cassette, subfamily B, multidrug efflux pump
MNSLWRLAPYMIPYRVVIVLGILSVFATVGAELAVPRLLQTVIDDGIRDGDMDIIVASSLWMLLAALVGAVAALGQGLCRAELSQGLAYDIRNNLFNHIQALGFSTLDQLRTGGLMTRIASDVNIIRMFSSNGLALLLRAVSMIAGSFVMVMLTDWQLSLIMLAFLVVAGGVIYTFMRMARPLFSVVQERLSTLNTRIQENLAGTQVVKAFVRETYEIDRFEDSNLDYMDQHIRVGRLLALVMPIITLLTNLGIVAVIWFGGLDVIGGRLTLGELVAFNSYMMIGMQPLLLLGNMVQMASRAEASAERVVEVFDTDVQADPGLDGHAPDSVRGEVMFDHVTFRYPGSSDGERDVLDGISFTAEPGRTVALMGATGSGKTTLVSLLSRFYDTTGGAVLVDGVDVRDWDLRSLRASIGLVSQQPLLFSGTVRENIAYGDPDASMGRIVEAAEIAQAHDFIMSMPDGYDSLIEARGANLSGGQKQRIAIARALLTAPPILILDDSTSAVDVETEILIQDGMARMLSHTTVFIIAQRVSSVVEADQIMILEGGRVSAVGTHRELLQSSPIYREIYQSQVGTEEPLAS